MKKNPALRGFFSSVAVLTSCPDFGCGHVQALFQALLQALLDFIGQEFDDFFSVGRSFGNPICALNLYCRHITFAGDGNAVLGQSRRCFFAGEKLGKEAGFLVW